MVVASGASGPEHYETVSRAIAQLGYDVAFSTATRWRGREVRSRPLLTKPSKCRTRSPEKSDWSGFRSVDSLGYGSLWPDQVAVDTVHPRPALKDHSRLCRQDKSVGAHVCFGESDKYKDCLIGTAHALAMLLPRPNSRLNWSRIQKTGIVDLRRVAATTIPMSYKDAFDRRPQA